MQDNSKPEGRFFLAIALTFGFLFVWFNYFAPKPAPVTPDAAVSNDVVQTPMQNNAKTVRTPLSAPAQDETQSEVPTQIVPAEYPLWEDSVETDLFELNFSNLGGGIVSAISLEHMQQKNGEDGVLLMQPTPDFNLPLSWLFELGGARIDDASVRFQAQRQADQITFSRELQPGIHLKKVFTWNNGTQKIHMQTVLENNSDKAVEVKSSVRLAAQELVTEKKSRFSFFAPQLNKLNGVAYISDSAERWPVEKFGTEEKPTSVPSGAIEWFGFEKQYFLFSAIPIEGRWESLHIEKAKAEKEGYMLASYPTWNLAPGQNKSYGIDVYAGPKDIRVLEKSNIGLEKAIDLGSWLGPIARPILRFLKWLHGWFPNYGVAIILLTVLVRLLMFPLTQIQAKSMKKMSVHKPQMDALKEQYKDDRESYSRELMTYMREHRINPASGCFLLVLQMPVFFALYRVLYNSIELRHAPFVLWIQDLSAHDPYFVLPVLLGIAMFFQQKLTPAAGVDPAQQAMMKFIPLMFTVFMIFLPAGLNIYILVSTLWGVAQQYWIQKSVHAPA